jgi:flagella basal body P-ring formation protein FlgA
MNVNILVNGEKRLGLPVFLNAAEKVASKAAVPLTPITPLKSVAEPPLVKSQQRITMTVRLGDLIVSAQGDALQDGRRGQNIRVLNIDSKKVVVGTVSGPGTIDVELAGNQP